MTRRACESRGAVVGADSGGREFYSWVGVGIRSGGGGENRVSSHVKQSKTIADTYGSKQICVLAVPCLMYGGNERSMQGCVLIGIVCRRHSSGTWIAKGLR